ncbi:MAG: PAS domain-containing protein [Pseudomonadota bacterium]
MPNKEGLLSRRHRTATLFTGLAMAIIFVNDFYTPLGFADGTLYVLCILTAGLTRDRRFVIMTAILAVVLTIIGAFVSPPGLALVYALSNRLVSVLTLTSTAFVAQLAILHIEKRERISSDLRRAIAEAEQSDQLLKIASDIAQLGGWVIYLPGSPMLPEDATEPKLVWSQEIRRIHGHTGDYAPTIEEALEYYSPVDRERILRSFRRCRDHGVPYDEEMQLNLPDGRRLWIRALGRPVYDPSGRVIQVQGAMQDLTWAKQLTEVINETEQRFQQLANALPLIIWTATPNGRVDFASKALAEFTGMPNHDLLSAQQWMEIVHEDDRERRMATWLAGLESSQEYSQEFRFRTASGEFRWLLVYARPMKDNHGKVLKWYGTAIDVHDSHMLQEDLKRSEQRLTYLVKATSDAIWDWNPNTRELWWSDSLYEMFGYRAEDMGTTGDFWAQCVHPEDRARVVPSIMQAAKGDAGEWRAEYRFQRKDGSYAWVSDRSIVLRDANGKALRLVGGLSDITARKSLEEQLQQTDRLRAVGQLTGGVAHDFNNLLTVIMGNSELLMDELATQQRLVSIATMIRDAAQRGAELTQRLLAFARRQALEPKVVNVKQLIDSMEGLLRRTLSAQIDIELVHAGGLWRALIDPAQLEGALLNLSLNARDAMQEGGRLTIETANMHLDQSYAERHPDVLPGQYVMIAVSDTGTGIQPQHLDKIFDPFFTTKGLGHGTGLGLSMVYGFVKQSNGHIKIYSELGQGTTVRIYLPRAQGEMDERHERPPIVRASGGSERILLVEDDDLVREYVEGQLRGLGYRVTTTTNASEALEQLRSTAEIDLLFTDVMMPGEMNGRQLAEVAIALRPGLKVLYTSGYTENAIVHHGRLDPGVQLLSKPYRRDELAQKLRSVLKLD